MHRRPGIGRISQLVPECRAQRRLEARLDSDGVDQGRPELVIGHCQQAAQRRCFGLVAPVGGFRQVQILAPRRLAFLGLQPGRLGPVGGLASSGGRHPGLGHGGVAGALGTVRAKFCAQCLLFLAQLITPRLLAFAAPGDFGQLGCQAAPPAGLLGGLAVGLVQRLLALSQPAAALGHLGLGPCPDFGLSLAGRHQGLGFALQAAGVVGGVGQQGLLALAVAGDLGKPCLERRLGLTGALFLGLEAVASDRQVVEPGSTFGLGLAQWRQRLGGAGLGRRGGGGGGG